VLTRFPSNVDSLKKGIIKTSKNKANKPYTILLLGETGVGKSSLLELIANVLLGNDVDHYNFNIVDNSNEQDDPGHRSQTNSARLYELTSTNGLVVSAGVLNTVGMRNLFPRFAFSTPLGSQTLAVFSKMSFTRGVLWLRSKSTSTPSMPS
jgi:energy-coupling factor transporter ATP-binding protein EcfA2